MKQQLWIAAALVATAVAHPLVTAGQDVALKDPVPKGMVVGVAVNQRQNDGDSWLNRGRANYPLLWDRQRQPKPAFQAVVDVLTRGR